MTRAVVTITSLILMVLSPMGSEAVAAESAVIEGAVQQSLFSICELEMTGRDGCAVALAIGKLDS